MAKRAIDKTNVNFQKYEGYATFEKQFKIWIYANGNIFCG